MELWKTLRIKGLLLVFMEADSLGILQYADHKAQNITESTENT